MLELREGYSHLRQSHKCGIIIPRQSAQTRITSELSILANGTGILQIECSTRHEPSTVSNYRQYCFGLLGLIIAMLMLELRKGYIATSDDLTNVGSSYHVRVLKLE